jgi:DNA-binding transcriptional ArsR family regulator
MEADSAIKRLSALAQDARLQLFRLLVKAGPDGMAAGDIARHLEIPPNTLSAQLLILANAELVKARRDGRSIIYRADFEAMTDLLVYLTQDCCGGRPEVCAPLAQIASQCCAPRKEEPDETPVPSRRRG